MDWFEGQQPPDRSLYVDETGGNAHDELVSNIMDQALQRRSPGKGKHLEFLSNTPPLLGIINDGLEVGYGIKSVDSGCFLLWPSKMDEYLPLNYKTISDHKIFLERLHDYNFDVVERAGLVICSHATLRFGSRDLLSPSEFVQEADDTASAVALPPSPSSSSLSLSAGDWNGGGDVLAVGGGGVGAYDLQAFSQFSSSVCDGQPAILPSRPTGGYEALLQGGMLSTPSPFDTIGLEADLLQADVLSPSPSPLSRTVQSYGALEGDVGGSQSSSNSRRSLCSASDNGSGSSRSSRSSSSLNHACGSDGGGGSISSCGSIGSSSGLSSGGGDAAGGGGLLTEHTYSTSHALSGKGGSRSGGFASVGGCDKYIMPIPLRQEATNGAWNRVFDLPSSLSSPLSTPPLSWAAEVMHMITPATPEDLKLLRFLECPSALDGPETTAAAKHSLFATPADYGARAASAAEEEEEEESVGRKRKRDAPSSSPEGAVGAHCPDTSCSMGGGASVSTLYRAIKANNRKKIVAAGSASEDSIFG